MNLIIGCDHAGYILKEEVKKYLIDKGFTVEDVGCYSEESANYPEYGYKVGQGVAKGKANFGIVICGSGIGISIAANKVKGIRCANVNTVELAVLSRQHNNANVLALGGRFVEKDLALQIVDAFLTTDFLGGRHQTRVEMLDRGC